MIPESYWRFLGRWWWLFVVFGAGGVGLALLYVSGAPIEYQSQAILQNNYVWTLDGKIKDDSRTLALEVNRLAVELTSAEVMTSLQEELKAEGYPGDLTTIDGGSSAGSVDVIPTKVSSRINEVPLLLIVAHANSAHVAQWLASKTAESFARRINEGYAEDLQRRQEFTRIQAKETAADLKSILAEKRQALTEESSAGNAAVQQLIDDNSRLLSELVLALGDLREEVSVANVDLGADTVALDQTISDLQQRVTDVANVWERRLKAPLETLYSAEADPDYQLALVREAVLQADYRDHIEQSNVLSAGVGASDQVTILARGTFAQPVKLLGLRKRYVVLSGAMIGLLVGWILASLGENILISRRRRRRAVDTDEEDSQTADAGGSYATQAE